MTTTEPLLTRRPTAYDGRGLAVTVLWVAALAWVGVLLVHGQHHGRYDFATAGPHEHGEPQHLAHTSTAGSLSPALWAGGWAFMVVAMMLPPALPLLRVAQRLVARRRRAVLLVVATAAAFVAVWLLAGVVFALGNLALGWVAGHVPAIGERPQLVSGAAAILAGAYQFSSFKRACLTACRSPLGLAMTTWTGTRPVVVSAAHLGARFGLVCVGCCWALMLLTFTVGTAAMPVMVVLAAVMALERLLPRIRPLVPLVGVAAVALGVLLLTGVVPPGLTA